MTKIHDVTVAFTDQIPPFPGDPVPRIHRFMKMEDGDPCNVSHMEMCVHSGTHVDAPMHHVLGGAGIETLPIEVMIGPCRVIDAGNVDVVTAAILEAMDLPEGLERLIVRTSASALWDAPQWGRREDFAGLSADAARWVVARGIRLVGIDSLTIEHFDGPDAPAHVALLEAAVVVIEGLDLRAIAPGDYELVCLPMKLAGCEGAPARVVLIEK